MIYLDHAATSWPKPPEVAQAMADFLERAGGNPGRSGHRLSVAAGRAVYEAREAVAELFNAPDPLRIIFTQNATHALNIAIRGLLRPGDRVVTTGMEHNSVMRPLRALEEQGVELAVVPCRADGSLDPAEMKKAVAPGAKLVVVTHASNVVGTLLPVAAVAKIAHDAGALLLVDAAQTAGCFPIDVQEMGIDLLAFTGHKALQGPTGTGGLVVGDAVDPAEMEPLMRGGTGSRSEREEQPEDLPDKYESGTCNAVGIAGLHAGIRFVTERGVDAVREHELTLTRKLMEGLSEVAGVTLYGPADAAARTATMSIRVAGLRVSDVGFSLDEEFGVLSRVGLHCAPAAHRTLGTFPEGTVRLAAGVFTTEDDIAQTVAAVKEVARV
jgi:cysteine desulfurase family protein